MKDVILLVDCPENLNPFSQDARSAIVRYMRVRDDFASQLKTMLLLPENAWRIPLGTHLPVFSALVDAAQKANLSYKVLFLEDGQAFIEYPSKAT